MAEFPENTVAFVTGAASGIGFETAKRLLLDGVRQVAIVDLTEELLAPALAKLTALPLPAPAPTIPPKVADSSAVANAPAEVPPKAADSSSKETVKELHADAPAEVPPKVADSNPKEAVKELPVNVLAEPPLAAPGPTILSIAADCSSEAAVEAAIAQTVKKFGRLDICVNNAGKTGGQLTTVDTDLAGLDDVLGLNLKGVWFCERAQLRQMMTQEKRDVITGLPIKARGAIVNIGSIASNVGLANLGPYVMSKHAVAGLTKVDAINYAKEGIRVNCIAPGCIKTNMTKILWEGPGVPMGDAYVATAPMSRWGSPAEVAYTASFLLSDRASFITGTCVNVDGGYCIQ